MFEVSTKDAIVTTESVHASPLDAVLDATTTAPAQEAPAQEESKPTPATELGKREEKLLDKLESLFVAGSRKLLANRVECGKLAHDFFMERLKGGNKDRKFSAKLIFNRLAVHAGSEREADGSELAHMYQTVQLLATGADWARLDIGRLLALRTLIVRVPDTEKEIAAREIFAWACGDGLKKPSIAEIRDRVLALVNPEEHAEKQTGKEANAKNGTDSAKKESAEEGKEAQAPDNLIATESRVLGRRPIGRTFPMEWPRCSTKDANSNPVIRPR
jgi:hypothetical protein